MQGYYIGMDAGGTGTTVLVSDGTHDLFQTRTEGLNCTSFSREQIEQSLLNAAANLSQNGFTASDCTAIGIGAAGNNSPAAPEIFQSALSKCGYRCPLRLFSDADAALYGAFEEEDGLLLISGTGSICLGQTDSGQTRYRAGGFGHLIDDEGSAYALGRDIISAVIRAEDGRGPETTLRHTLFQTLGISDSSELVGYVYDRNHTKKDIARLARLISLPESRDDEAVEQIVKKAAAALFEAVAAVYRRMEAHCSGNRIPLVLHGSVLRNNERIAGDLKVLVSSNFPRIQVTAAKADAAHGAVGLAVRHCQAH